MIVSAAQRVHDEIMAAIDEEIERASGVILTGVPATFEHYRKTVGLIEGLKRSRGIVGDAFKNTIDPQRTA